VVRFTFPPLYFKRKGPLTPVLTGLKIGSVEDLVSTFEKEEFSDN
jgi:hypothetical protein